MNPERSFVPARASVFRIGRFAVPQDAMPAFMTRLEQVRSVIGAQPGCQQNLVLTQTMGPGEYNVMTLVEWSGPEAMAAAKAAIEAHQAEEGFDPEAFRHRLGIRADSAVYTAVPFDERLAG